jgi:hypothetical protein
MDNATGSNYAWPIKFVWEGAFRYPLTKSDGHQWYYEDVDSWQIKRLSSCPPVTQAPEPLAQTAREILAEGVFKKIPAKYRKDTFFKTIQWLASKDSLPPQPVRRGLSVVLNSIVLDATLKSFRIVTTFVGEHVTVNIQGLKSGEPQWFYLKDEDIPLDENMLVAPQMFFELVDGKISKPITNFEKAVAQFKCIRVLHDYTVTDFHVSDDRIELTLKDQVTMCRYPKGELCGCIPVPGKQRKGSEPENVLTPEVIVSSPVVAKALEELSLIWQDRNTKKSVLISAPPGSGKEVFCSGIVYGNGRPTENFQSLSMASDDQADLEKQLLGDETAGVLRRGLIEKAAKSGLFLDEVHQPEAPLSGNNSAARSALLRPLESREFIPKGSSTVVKVDDVLFIMATSKSREQLKAFNPPDFWTRMTHFVEIPHPLEIHANNSENLDHSKIDETLRLFFNFFWWERVDDFVEAKRGSEKRPENYSAKLLAWQRMALHSVVEHGWSAATVGKEDFEKISKNQKPPGVVFAKVLREVLQAHQPKNLKPHECSIRGIRNMVCRLFYISATRVAQGEYVLPVPKIFEDNARAIATEIVPLANISKADKDRDSR